MTKEYPPTKDCPTIWFARLERAREAGDKVAEDRAASELQRLGVTVEFKAVAP